MSVGLEQVTPAGQVGQTDRFAVEGRGQDLAVARQGDAAEVGEAAFQPPALLARLHVPKDQVVVDPGGQEGLAVGGEDDLFKALFPPPLIRFVRRQQFPNFLSICNVDQVDVWRLKGVDGNQLAVGRPGEVPWGFQIQGDPLALLARGHVMEADGVVIVGRNQRLPVFGEDGRGGELGASLGRPRAQLLPGGRVPEVESPEVAAALGSQHLAVGGETDADVAPTPDGANGPGRGDVPELDGVLVVARGGQGRAVRRQGGAVPVPRMCFLG
jgi:hypothetical protein